ncbi:MAG: N-(5'-phosphoribosyl)anthranilate isomerase [Gammaproteobacteria bacterium]|nr:N-(5'-phosphoribosyl)anthranilate isomerase [Gammaproteobacteria bacterium]
MRIHVKICGITDLRGATVAAEAGADSVGFVFASSLRQITPEEAARLARGLPKGIDRVAVFLRPTAAELARTLAVFDADAVQADHTYLQELDGRRLLPVFRETERVDAELDAYVGSTTDRRLVYEGPRSGVGRTVDWTRAFGVARRGQVTLAGGLHPDNVGEAIRTVRPFGVDVSSGVESKPGVKDPGRLRAFVEAVREAEKALVGT